MFSFQKWYFDAVARQGDVLICYLTSLRFLGWTQSSASADFYSRDGFLKTVRCAAPPVLLDHALGSEAWKGIVSTDGGGLMLAIGDGVGQVRIVAHPRDAGPSGAAACDIVRTAGSYLSWHIPAARTDVTGSCCFNESVSDFFGTGYHDVIHSNIPFWHLPIDELFWGRAHCDAGTVVFDVVRFRNGKELRLLHVDDVHRGGVTFGEFAFDMDESGEVRLRGTHVGLRLVPDRILVDAPVDTAGRIRPAFIGPALARLCGDPWERKICGRADVSIGDRTYSGTALWERVRWRWRRSTTGGTRA